MKYLKRTADNVLQDNLDASSTVLIEGPKWCSKTTTASQKARSSISLQDVDKHDEYLTTATAKPSLLLVVKYRDFLMNGRMLLYYGMLAV